MVDFAKRLGVSQASVSKYESGRPPSAEFLGALIGGLNVNANWLLTGSGPMYIEPGQPSGDNELSVLLGELEAQLGPRAAEALPLLRQIVDSGYLGTEFGPGALKVLVSLCELQAAIPPSRSARQSEDQAEGERRRRA